MSTPLPESSVTSRLSDALDRLVGRGVLSRRQAEAVLLEVGVSSTRPARVEGSGLAGAALRGRGADRRAWTTVLAEVGGYVGAAFVVAAVLVFTGPRWGELSQPARLSVLGIPALLVLVGAALLAQAAPGGWTPYPRDGLGPRRRLISALVLAGGGLLGGVVAQLVDTGVDASGEREATLVGLTVLAVWAVGYAGCRILLLHLGMATAACMTVAAGISWTVGNDVDGRAIGLGLVAVALAWFGLSLLRVLLEQDIGYGVAGVIGFIGAEAVATGNGSEWLGYLLLAALATAGIAGYVRTRMLTVLVVGVVALGTVVPQSIIDYTDGALGAAGALLVTGLSIVGASVLGLRIHREVPGRHDRDDEPEQ